MASLNYTMVLDDARLEEGFKAQIPLLTWMIQQSQKMSRNMLFFQGKGTFSIN
jgi:hypothetical protein